MTIEESCELLKMLAEPTRLRLVALLQHHGTLCVCELERVTGLPQYHVSRRLSLLRRAGLAETQRDGSRIDYRLRGDLDPAVQAVIAAAVAVAAADPVCQADQAAARRVRPSVCANA